MSKANKKTDKKDNDIVVSASIPTIEASKEAKDRLMLCKIDLYRNYPFLGFLIMTIDYRWTDVIPTMAATTEPHNIVYLNEQFLMKSLPTRQNSAAVLAHEICHIFLDHIGRQKQRGYNPELWNVACDYAINWEIDKLKDTVVKLPKSALLDAKYGGMSADEIYYKLIKDNNNSIEEAIKNNGGGQGSIGGDYNDGKQRPFDVVSSEDVSSERKFDQKQKLAQACSITDKNSIKNMGEGAANLYRQFIDIIEPYIPWQDVLRDFIVNKCASHYTYNKASRRSTKDIIFPRLDGDFIDVVFGVDTSGSMSDKDIGEALTELYGICEEFSDWKVTLLSCDTSPHEIGVYNSEEGDDFSSINKNLIGGGGTDMTPMVNYVNEMEELPSVMIILTDGYIPDIQNVDDVPTIVVVTSSGNKDLSLKNDEIQILRIN